MKENNSHDNLRKAIAASILGAVSAFALALPAFAAEPEVASLTVKFADLNVSGQAGAEKLYSRIQHAAQEVCSPLDGRQLQDGVRFKTCVKEAIARAVSRVNQPTLSSVYAAKNGIASTTRLASLQVP